MIHCLPAIRYNSSGRETAVFCCEEQCLAISQLNENHEALECKYLLDLLTPVFSQTVPSRVMNEEVVAIKGEAEDLLDASQHTSKKNYLFSMLSYILIIEAEKLTVPSLIIP